MLMIALDLLVTAYQGILLAYTIKRQFERFHSSAIYDAAFVVAFVSFFAVIQYLNIPIPEFCVTLILFLYMKVASRERSIVCALWSILDVFLLLGTLTLVSGLFDLQITLNGNVLEATEETRIIYFFVGSAAVTVVLNIAAKFSKAANIISKTETILFIFTLLLCFLINECFFLARLSGHADASLLIGSACSFAVMVLTMVLYDRLTEATQRKRQMELAAQTAQLVAEHQEELKSIYTYMLAEQHDLRHRVAAAEEILSSGNISPDQRTEALELLKTSEQPRLFVTGCIAVDAILKAKLTVMENAGISFELNEYPLLPLPISEQDFCMLLGNLLDNAIEGVMRLPAACSSRNIRLSFSKVWDMLFITCVNDANPETIKQKGNDFISSKEHPERHGFGLKSLKKIVEDAGGNIDIEIKQNKFSVEIMLGGTKSC